MATRDTVNSPMRYDLRLSLRYDRTPCFLDLHFPSLMAQNYSNVKERSNRENWTALFLLLRYYVTSF